MVEVQKWFDEMDNECDQVIYMPGQKKYDYESSAMTAHFKNVYRKELAGIQVIHDGRNRFKIDSEFICADGAD